MAIMDMTTAEVLMAEAQAAILMPRDDLRATYSTPPAPVEVRSGEAPTIYDVMSASRGMISRPWVSGVRSFPTQQPIEQQLPITSGGLRSAAPAVFGV